MTNQEILTNEILNNKLMTKEELQNYIEEHLALPLYLTFAQWNKRGYKVKKGQKAIIKTKLWLKSKRKTTETKNSEDEEIEHQFVLVNASLFSIDQAEKVVTE